MSMPDPPPRAVGGQRLPNENDKLDASLRPRYLKEYIGQERVVENLKVLIEAARQRGEALDHILFYGPPGLGKTTLAHVLANEMETNIRTTAGPTIERAGDLAAILTHQRAKDILFIDEIHRLGRPVEEVMYSAMEDFVLDIVIGKGPAAKNVRLNLPRFTVTGATTRLALLTAPLRDRFGAVFRMDFYSLEAMQTIVERASAKLKVLADEDGITEIARRSRGTPRVALRLLKRVRDYAQVRAAGAINRDVAAECLSGLLEIDELGLDDIDRRVLLTIIENFNGGPVGLETIAASISEEADTIMDVIEPFLLQLGFLERTSRGRMATRRAYEHLGLAHRAPPAPPLQNVLFSDMEME